MSDLRFDGRVAIVTGSARGLGRAHAMLLAERGAMVVVNDIGTALDGHGIDVTPAEATVADIERLGGVAVTSADSVTTPEGGAAIVQTAIDAFGRVDIIVNNAGFVRDKAFHTSSIEEHVDPLIDVHLRGAFNVLHAAWPHLREQRYGRVVNTTSAVGLVGNFGQVAYAAAKAGLIGLTRALAHEGERFDIRVNAIAPMAATRMTESLISGRADVLVPERVSPVVAYLAHEDCAVSGEIYSATGGYVARAFVGFTHGIVIGPSITPEAVRDRLEEIRDATDYYEPEDGQAEAKRVYPRLD